MLSNYPELWKVINIILLQCVSECRKKKISKKEILKDASYCIYSTGCARAYKTISLLVDGY